jgi:hypothetical protein
MNVKIRKLAVDGYRKDDYIIFSLFNYILLLFIKGDECLHIDYTGFDDLINSYVLELYIAYDLNF